MYKCGLYTCTYQLDRRLYGDIMDGLDNRARGFEMEDGWMYDGCKGASREQRRTVDVVLYITGFMCDQSLIKINYMVFNIKNRQKRRESKFARKQKKKCNRRFR